MVCGAQVIVKSCKMIPVMAVSVLVRGKRYPVAAYVRVAMVTLGIICFTFFKKKGKVTKGSGSNSVFGLGLALASLLMDGFVGPTQVIYIYIWFRRAHAGDMGACVLASVRCVCLYTRAT